MQNKVDLIDQTTQCAALMHVTVSSPKYFMGDAARMEVEQLVRLGIVNLIYLCAAEDKLRLVNCAGK